VRAHERVGLGDRPVHVRFGGEVDDRVDAPDHGGDGVGVLDRAEAEFKARIRLEVAQAFAPAGIGELVEHDDLVVVLAQAHANEVRADEARPAADQQPHAWAPLRVSAR
jgi:hypothetical protein